MLKRYSKLCKCVNFWHVNAKIVWNKSSVSTENKPKWDLRCILGHIQNFNRVWARCSHFIIFLWFPVVYLSFLNFCSSSSSFLSSGWVVQLPRKALAMPLHVSPPSDKFELESLSLQMMMHIPTQHIENQGIELWKKYSFLMGTINLSITCTIQ